MEGGDRGRKRVGMECNEGEILEGVDKGGGGEGVGEMAVSSQTTLDT